MNIDDAIVQCHSLAHLIVDGDIGSGRLDLVPAAMATHPDDGLRCVRFSD